MKRTSLKTLVIAIVVMMTVSCSREKRFDFLYNCQETHTLFHITVANNTKTRTKTSTKTKADAQAMYTLFESYGFDMRPMVLDANLEEMRKAINGFRFTAR